MPLNSSAIKGHLTRAIFGAPEKAPGKASSSRLSPDFQSLMMYAPVPIGRRPKASSPIALMAVRETICVAVRVLVR